MQTINFSDIGEVKLRKSSRAKRIILKINHLGQPEVTVPQYVPYIAAKRFVISQKKWILKHSTTALLKILTNNQKIGRQHYILFTPQNIAQPVSRVSNNVINIKHPVDLPSDNLLVQKVARQAAERAVKIEANSHLPTTLHSLARKYDYNYKSVSVKNMRSRWGSCSSEGVINLNIWLMQLPDELIKYVCCHELTHLNHPHHRSEFWEELSKMEPNYKQKRRQLKLYKPYLD